MSIERPIRVLIFGVILLALIAWTIGSGSAQQADDYPNADLLASAQWLSDHADDANVVIVDVRGDEHYDGNVIPGAIRMPWGQFRVDDPIPRVGSVFIGVSRAQELIGEHGIERADTVVVYDDVERDGGATASYVFWILELLGHENVKVLNGGIEAWERAGGEVSDQPAELEPVVYQAAPEEIVPTREIRGSQIYERLGDRYYQVLDVRSRDEYVGEAPNAGWQGKALKLGHIPGAYNINYKDNWVDAETKLVKPYAELQRMYAGLDPSKAVVTYCHSGRRSSYSYFILRLMGFADPRLYDYSWNEWGSKSLYYPVERKANPLSGMPVSAVSMDAAGGRSGQTGDPTRPTGGDSSGGEPSGYISCGG